MANETQERIAVMAIILAILFGILQYIPKDKTYDNIVFEMLLKVISQTFFQIALGFFLAYFILLAINLRYDKKPLISQKILKFFYNTGIFITIAIILLASSFYLIIYLIMKFPLLLRYGQIVLIIVWIIILISLTKFK